MRLLKILGLIVVAVVNLVALSIVAVARVRSQTRDTYSSFRVGLSPFHFRIPDGAKRVSIRFSSASDPREDCGRAVIMQDDKLLLTGETTATKEFSDSSQLPAIVRAQRWDIERCTEMYVTISNWPLSWPYRGTVKVHYAKGVVTKVEKPFFWE